MSRLLGTIIVIIIMLSGWKAHSQTVVRAEIVGNDTIPVIDLPTVRILDEIGEVGEKRRRQYHQLIYDVQQVLPYAKLFARKMKVLDSTLKTFDKKSKRKAFLKKQEKKLKEDLRAELKDLTYDQGRILIKLINRETGKTTYELIKRYKSGFNATMWQVAAGVFGMNLKNEYDKDKEEAIEKILDALEEEKKEG